MMKTGTWALAGGFAIAVAFGFGKLLVDLKSQVTRASGPRMPWDV